MREIGYTLLSDGVSDQALIPLLTWLLIENGVEGAIQPQWADMRALPKRPHTLAERMKVSLELYPCDLLFVHRDAEREPPENRYSEIREAKQMLPDYIAFPTVCVVPVRMQEAWLLFDEVAIRIASGNRNGKMPLSRPRIKDLEQLPDPKEILYDILRDASGLKGRRRARVPVATNARRVAEFIDDFAPLRGLSAFRALEADIAEIIQAQGWHELTE